MKLPNPDLAVIDERKLAGYSLNLDHDEGKHKARVFKAALNMDVSHLEELKQALRSAIETDDAVPRFRNAYGQKYIIDFPLTREDKTAIIHVEEYEPDVFEVEFSDTKGRAYALETLNSSQLLVLHHQSRELMMAG